MDFIDLKAQQERIRASLDKRIAKVLDHGGYILGPEVQELESKLNNYCGTKFCLSCANGTDALLMPLLAMGIGPNDVILAPAFTFFATAEVIGLLGAKTLFVDVDPKTFNITNKTLEAAMEMLSKKHPGLKARGLISVNLFGLPADYDSIGKFCQKYNLFCLEDAAQSFGSSYHGRKSCSLASISATSFFPAKPLGCYGDGGAVFCDDEDLYLKLKSIRVHGQGQSKYHNERLGLNARLDTIQAAVLLEKLTIFDEELDLRNNVAARYTEQLRDLVKSGFIQTPIIPEHCISSWAQYTLIVKNRDGLIQHLNKSDIPTMIYYVVPMHLQEAFKDLGYIKGDLPNSEMLSDSVVSIPMHPYLTLSDQDKIIAGIRAFYT